ncbi:PREDICTED: acidic repeat-containing protein [Galeopterus variegatus]|uniref:Acidic repeat-containing protein n=1 Tax=Galeopterus variegatus TaxID=482537 RepID=A0ABM0S8V5_GALVR|nr:PREDICTED: acidic repeat-containing protein [Galeopterus variegatus]
MEPTIQEPPILITDDDDDDNDSSDLEGPVLEDLCDQGQISSAEKELAELATFRRTSDAGVGEQDFGKNLCQPPNGLKPNLEILDRKLPSDDEPVSVVEQPKKRKEKTKNLCVTPAVKERKTRGPSKKKPTATEVEKGKTGHSVCKVPGCFLRDVENLKQYSGKNFKKNKDELVEKICHLFNSSVFDKKLPEKMDISWSNKMLRTAGLCTTGRKKREPYAKIQISLKVCDSADRLRDTLIHELCHAASWLFDGVCDSHGDAWKYYANKCNMVHPELPKITRCHNYKINYKIYYECTQCKARFGRYSKSLKIDRSVCGRCGRPLVMVPLTRKDGTPIKPHVRPFARYVQENYTIVMKEVIGNNHGDVMKKLGKDYLAKKQKQLL